MSYLRIFIFLVLTGSVFSCNTNKQDRKDYSPEIDSLLTELRTLDDSLNSLNIREVQKLNDSLRAYYDTAEVQDTQERRFRVYERSRNIIQWYGNVNREINYSRSHLRALREKFEREKLPDSTKKKEFEEERQIFASIKDRFDEEYESLKKEMEDLLNRQGINE